MASGIRWKRGDYISLGRTIADFNRKINELETEENKLYLPEKINYASAKEDIKTRNELNRFIKNLRNFTADTAEVITLESGNKLLEWDYENLKNLRRTATRRLQNVNVNKEVQPYETQEETLARANINYMKSLETADKEKFNRIRQNLYRVGRADYTYKKAEVYRQNYLDSFSGAYGNYENFDILKNKLESIKNPIKFFDYIQQDEALADMFLYYDKSHGLIYAGANDEDSFNSILERLGLIEDIEEDVIVNNDEKNIKSNKKYAYRLQAKDGTIIAQSDSRQTLVNMILNSTDRDITTANIFEN